MRKFFIMLVVVSISAGTLQAQDFQRAKIKRMKKVVLGLVATPEYFSCIDKSMSNANYEYEYTGKFSSGVGLDVWYGFSTELFFTTGLYQSFRKYIRKEICYDCANGFNYESEFKLNYLDFPIGVAYKIINKRADLIVQGGFIFSFLEKATENRNSISGSYYDFNVKGDYNKMMYGFNAGVGTNYNLTYRLSVGLIAGYRMYFSEITSQIPVKWHGLSTVGGIYYKF